jgi:hypothetical protein
MLTTRRILLALSAVCLSLVVFASAAMAGEPANVTVRVEGLTETKLESTAVTTTTAPVVKDGNSADACSGTSALGALQLASSGDWSGPWNGEFDQYEIYSIEGETHEFESTSNANYYWSLWVNEQESSVGACEAELHPGDRVLFFPSCYGSACPPSPLPLGVEAPASANVGEKVSVTVKRYSTTGEAKALEGASVTGASANAATNASGAAAVSFSSPGRYTLRISAPESVRTEATICVHNGNDGNCGTTAPSTTGTTTTTTPVPAVVSAPYKGPYALVAKASGVLDGHVYAPGKAPRVLAGTIAAQSAVSSVSLELRRSYRGRCYAYDGTTTRFVRARCGQGSSFKVSSDGSFSYLLPAALPPGRYVLDIQATDVAGNHSTLARGSSRIVFYVR